MSVVLIYLIIDMTLFQLQADDAVQPETIRLEPPNLLNIGTAGSRKKFSLTMLLSRAFYYAVNDVGLKDFFQYKTQRKNTILL